MTLPRRVEVAVVGAGPAGSTVACALAERGYRVALLERDRFPRDKVCGEFLSPESVDCLKTVGCFEEFVGFEPPEMTRTRLCVAGNRPVELQLPGVAFGLSRKCLDAMLFHRARECGAEAFEGAHVRRIDRGAHGRWELEVALRSGDERRQAVLEAALVVGAHGRRSGVDRQMNRPFFQERSPLVAFKRHHRIGRPNEAWPIAGFVELHAFDGGYCGVSYVEDGVVNVCTMFGADLLEEGKISSRTPFESLARYGGPALRRRLAMLEPCQSEICTTAQIALRPREVVRDGVVFVGDAAGMIAPLAGDGQAMAMEGALLLAEVIDRRWPRSPAEEWSTLWRRRYARRLWLGRRLQAAMTRTPIARTLGGLISRFPSIGERLVTATRSESLMNS